MLVFCVLLLLQTVLLQADGVVLDSTLEADRFACPGTPVRFTCTVEGVNSLRWVAVPYINATNPITSTASDSVGDETVRPPFTANLTSISQVNNLLANLTSDLFTANVSVLGAGTIVIQCIDPGNNATRNLSVEARPNSPRDVRGPGMITEFENFTITWEPPENSAEFNLQRYQITVMPTSLVYNCTGPNCTDTQITVEGLRPDEYTIKVVAITECDTRSPAATTTVSVVAAGTPIPTTGSSASSRTPVVGITVPIAIVGVVVMVVSIF